jgi:hypothetical protein
MPRPMLKTPRRSMVTVLRLGLVAAAFPAEGETSELAIVGERVRLKIGSKNPQGIVIP